MVVWALMFLGVWVYLPLGFGWAFFGFSSCCSGGLVVVGCGFEVQKWGPKIVKNGPRVWAFCKIEFPGIQKPVQILAQKSGFFRNPGDRGVGVIWLVRGVGLVLFYLFPFGIWLCAFVSFWLVLVWLFWGLVGVVCCWLAG